MNSLPSSYSGSYLGKIAARSSGLENRVDLEKYTQGWEGSVNGIAISSIAVLWFFVQHPLPSHFLGGGGGGLSVSLHLQDRLWRGIWGLEKIVQQVKHHQNPSAPPPLPTLLLGARAILIAFSPLHFSEFCAFRGFPTRNLHKFATHEGLLLVHKNKQYVKAQNTHGVRHA